MLLKIKNYFSDVKHIINLIIIILAFNTMINILSGAGGIFQTIIPLLYFCIIRFSKKVNLSIWNMVFFIWSILYMIVHFITPTSLTIINSIILFLYLLFINFGNKLNILNMKNLSIVFIITIVVLMFGCFIDIRFFLTSKSVLTGLSYLLTKIGFSNTLNMVIAFNIISIILVFLYQVLVIIYFKQFANYKIRSAKNE